MDLKAIADEAVTHVDAQAAFVAMSSQEQKVLGVLSGNELRIWAASHPAEYSQLKAASASDPVAEMAVLLVQEAGSVMDLGNASVQAMVGALVSGGVLTQVSADALYALAEKTVKTWPGLEIGNVEYAIRRRQEGSI